MNLRSNLLLLLAVPAIAAGQTAPCVLTWDAQTTATDYRVWRGIDLLATVRTHQATVQLSSYHLSSLVVTARNSFGESERSEPLTLRPVRAEFSTALGQWKTGSVSFVEDTPSLFMRFATPGSDANNLPFPTMSFQPFKGFFPFVPPAPPSGGGGAPLSRWVIAPNAAPGLRNDFNGVVGGTFFVGASPVVAKGLGRYLFNTAVNNHRIGLWDANTATFITEVTVLAGTPPGWVELPITHTTLSASGIYFVALEVTGGDGDQWQNTQPVTTTGIEDHYLSCYKFAPYGMPTNTHDNGTLYGPVTIYY